MTQQNGSKNLEAVKTFFDALEQHNTDAIAPLLAPEVVELLPFWNTGDSRLGTEFRGKEGVLGYASQITENFSHIVLVDKRFYVLDDGSTVFFEARGDFLQSGTSASYQNVYIFKFLFEGGQIVHISEYTNPILYAKLMGLPLG